MNCTYRLIWSTRLQAFIVAAENARSRGKASGLKALSAVVLSAVACSAHALPEGGVVSGDAGIIDTSTNTVTVTQTSAKLAINWAKFGTTAGESVVFNQPNASAIALNRVTGSESSSLFGSLSATGQVWLLNPNGVQIGSGATINVGGWVASTLGLSDDAFMNSNGKLQFAGNGSGGSVSNQGSIAAPGGYVALLGGKVSNDGSISARLGTLALAAGNKLTLDFAGDKLMTVQVDEGVAGALVHNKHMMTADGGRVLMTAKGVDALFTTVVNNEGTIRAQTVDMTAGRIELLGSMDGGVTRVSGTLDASAPGSGDGGFIETSGVTVQIAGGAQVTTTAPWGKTGLWKIGANDFTIAASGGNISGTTLGNRLAANNVTISTALQGAPGGNGDMHVNDAVSWNAATTLTLTAHRHINVNASITAQSASPDAGLILTPGTGGAYTLNQSAQINLKAEAKLAIAGNTYTVINTVEAL